MKKFNSNGFSVVELLLILVVIGIIGGAGYFVYNSRQDANASLDSASKTKQVIANKSKKTTKKEDYIPPEGWVLYTFTDKKLSFYHPGDWSSDRIEVNAYKVTEAIPSNYGTPDSLMYNQDTKTWESYLNYGDPSQKKSELDTNEPGGAKTIKVEGLTVPVMYRETVHAAVVTYDVHIVTENQVYRVRLPEINTFESGWEAALAKHAEAIPNIATSISIK